MGKQSIYFLIFLLSLLAGCSSHLPVEPSASSGGILAKTPISFKMAGVPGSINSVKATLSRTGYDTIFVFLTMNGDSASGSITDIAIGTWHLQVDASDSSLSVVFTGQTDVDVLPGGISNVNLTLTQATGGININVNWAPTNLGNAIYLDGQTGYIEIPNSPSLSSIDTAITIEAWVNPNYQYYNTIICQGLSNYGIEFAEGLNPGVFLNRVNAPLANYYWGRVMAPIQFSPNVWSHIAISYSPSTGINVYMNGNLMYQTPASGIVNCGGVPLRIGARVDPVYTEYFNGAIDDVRLWNVVRSQNDIKQNMSNELTGSESGLIGYWKFDEQPGSTVIHDATSNHNDGQVHGNVIIKSIMGN